MKLLTQNLFLHKKLLFTLSTLLLACLTCYHVNGQVTIWSEDFEDNGNTANGGAGRYSSPNDFYDSAQDDDYWGRVRASDRNYFLTNTTSGFIANSANVYGGQNGSFFYAGEDLDDIGGALGSPDGMGGKQILFTGININGGTNMVFKGLFAAGDNTDPCGSSQYDNPDHIEVYYEIDGGGEILGMCFNPDLECNIPGDITNEPLYHDNAASQGGACDGDGGGGTLLSNGFQEFSFPIVGTGTMIDIRVEVFMDSGNEEVAMDFFRLESDTPTPVEFYSFIATKKGEKVKLNWYTASEIENDFFAIERSSDGVYFEKIGILKGQGNAIQAHSYEFIDESPAKGDNYYRLQQVNWDTSFDYSEVVSVTFESKNSMDVVPNPFKGMMTIDLSEAYNKDTKVEIFNLLGQQVYISYIPRDVTSKNFDLSALEQGTYMLKLGEGEESLVKRIVKF